MQESFLSEIKKLAQEVSEREGCYLYDLEFVGAGNGRVLRVTIDKDALGDQPAGVSVEDCTNISRAMNLRLDVEDVIPGGQYQLEVSSPGLERHLKEPRHYQWALGKTVSVKSFAPLAQFNETLPTELLKAKQIQAPLKSFDDKGLYVAYVSPSKKGEPPGEPVRLFIPFESVTKAHVVFEFQEPQKPSKGGLKPKPHPMHHAQSAETAEGGKQK